MRKFLAVTFWLISLAALVLGLMFSWFIRDGLGPDALESHGLVAWQHFWDGGGLLWLLIWVIPPLILGCLVYPWRLGRHSSAEQDRPSGKGSWFPPPTS